MSSRKPFFSPLELVNDYASPRTCVHVSHAPAFILPTATSSLTWFSSPEGSCGWVTSVSGPSRQIFLRTMVSSALVLVSLISALLSLILSLLYLCVFTFGFWPQSFFSVILGKKSSACVGKLCFSKLSLFPLSHYYIFLHVNQKSRESWTWVTPRTVKCQVKLRNLYLRVHRWLLWFFCISH